MESIEDIPECWEAVEMREWTTSCRNLYHRLGILEADCIVVGEGEEEGEDEEEEEDEMADADHHSLRFDLDRYV